MCLAIPGKLIEISNDSNDVFKSGRVSFDGVIKDINLALVPEAKINDYVLVHVGTAIGIVDEDAANETFELLRELEASKSKITKT